jgi:ribosome maturation factor RimP
MLPYIVKHVRVAGAGPRRQRTYLSGDCMADIATLTDLIEPEVKALGFALVRIKLFGSGEDYTLQIKAEDPKTKQLVIEDCATISRRLSDVLDEADPIEEAYRLEVSSPGIDRPLTRLHDFQEWASHEAKIATAELVEGRKSFRGILGGTDGEDILFTDAKAGDVRIPFALVTDAKLMLTDRLISATMPLSSDGADEFETEE